MALYSTSEVVLGPGQRAAVGIGWAIEFPDGYVARILGRSGLAIKHGLTAAIAGVIDSNFRGEWQVLIINLGQEQYIIHQGDKIAQAVFFPFLTAQPTEIHELSETSRGEDGFGSTGY